MGWIIKLGNKVIGHITRDYGVLEQYFATEIENCLLAYGIKTYLGDEVKTPIAYGFKLIGPNSEYTAIAVKRCIAFNLHRRVSIKKKKIYVLEKNFTDAYI